MERAGEHIRWDSSALVGPSLETHSNHPSQSIPPSHAGLWQSSRCTEVAAAEHRRSIGRVFISSSKHNTQLGCTASNGLVQYPLVFIKNSDPSVNNTGFAKLQQRDMHLLSEITRPAPQVDPARAVLLARSLLQFLRPGVSSSPS